MNATVKARASTSILATTDYIEGAQILGLLNDYIDSPNLGLCYGFCVAAYLDKLGKIDFNTNTCNATTINNVPKPYTDCVVESALLYFHIAQFISANTPSYYSKYGADDESTVDFTNMLATTRRLLTNTGPVILALIGYETESASEYGHAILVESCSVSYVDLQPVYTFQCYDPNYAGTSESTFTLSYISDPDNQLYNWILASDDYGFEYYIVEIRCITKDDFTFFDTYDFDLEYNSKSYVGST